MILKAKHHRIIYPFFRLYTILIMRRHFKIIRIIGEFRDHDLPILIITNHVSWWDGFWAIYFNMKILKRKFHFMMLEEQLRKYWLFNYSGGFSVRKKSRSILETIQYTNELLTNKRNMVLLFPQGEFQSMHNQEFKFEKGIERILKNQRNPVQVIFLANMVDYFSEKKPGLYMYFCSYPDQATDLKTIQDSYNAFYHECIEKQSLLKG